MSTDRYLVTGGLGFVGQSLIQTIRKTDAVAHICVLDVDVHGRRNLLSGEASLDVIPVDIRDGLAVDHVIRDFRPNIVFHLAAMHYLPECVIQPRETISVNCQGTENVVRGLNRHKHLVRRFVFTSSAAVYRETGSTSYTESDAIGGCDIYGESKSKAESVIASECLFPWTILRLSNVYGPDDPVPHLVPSICRQVASDSPVIEVGTLGTVRDYLHVDDVAQALCHARYSQGNRDVFNAGTGIATSGYDLMALVEDLAGKRLSVNEVHQRRRAVDRPRLVLDARLIYSSFGWTAAVGLKSGLEAIIRAKL